MPRQLDHVLKLTRANEHLDCLRNECEWWLASHPYRVVTEPEVESGYIVMSAEPFGKPPVRISLVVGDVVHNLRSCLDQLALRLAEVANGGKLSEADERASQFPICPTPASFRRSAQRQLAHVDPAPLAVIESVQPYGANPGRHPLERLRLLSDFDKHRRLPLIGQNARLQAADVLAEEWSFANLELSFPQPERPFDARTEIFRYRDLQDPRDGSDPGMDIRLSVDLAFASDAPAGVAGQLVLPVIEELWNFVGKKIVLPLRPYADPGRLPE